MSALAGAVRARCELLGLEPVGAALLALDLYLVAAFAVAVVRRLRVARRGTLRELVALGLVGFAAVVLPATLLGALHMLSNLALIAAHAILAAMAVGFERPGATWRSVGRIASGPLERVRDFARLVLSLGSRRAWNRSRRVGSLLLAGILVVLAFYALLATWTLPLTYDSNTYRLSRIALWLQEGSIHHIPTDDSRLNYVGHNADLVMLWLISFFPAGYPLVHWVQYAAGLLACATVYELGRMVGLNRVWRLGAIAALLGMPSVALQFFTSQTDLFAAATLAAGVMFGLVALRRRRAAEWLLAATGVGLAVGAKGTVFYFGPGLALLFAGWMAIERTPWRDVARGVAVAAGALLLLGGFNYGQNLWTFGHPLAPPEAIRTVHAERSEPIEGALFQLERVLWQVLEPASNPLLPEAVRAPLFDRLTAHLSASLGEDRNWRQSLDWMDGSLDEDHASFGLVATLAILAGGVAAGFRSLRRPRRSTAGVAAMFAAVAAFVAFFCQVSTMNTHHFRYFALVAPFGAVVAIAGFAGARAQAVRAFGGLFVVAQLLTAGLVGLRSEYHGWGALRDPSTSTFYSHWRDGRDLVAAIGQSPRRVVLAFPEDRWLAPYLRTATAHRFRTVTEAEVAGAGSAGRFLAGSGDDVLVANPSLLRSLALDDVAVLPAPWILRSPQLALRRLSAGELPRPAIVEAEGITWDGWTAPRASLRVAGWRGGPLELELQNPTPIPRRLAVLSRRDSMDLALEPNADLRLVVDLAPRDTVTIRTRPPFLPAEHDSASTDRRELGVLISPSRAVAEAGVSGDGWTGRSARIALVNWVSGVCELELANPTPLVREVRVVSRLGERRLNLAPGAGARLAIEVLPADRLTLEVEPPFVPAASDPRSRDARELGVLLGQDLLRQPHGADYR